MKYIDIHGHINFAEYDNDREEVIKRAKDSGVGIVIVGTNYDSSKKCIEIAEKYENVWAVVGMHPITNEATDGSVEDEVFNDEAFRELAKNPKVIAIGECGLDYYHSKPEDIGYQKEIFIKQIEIANSVNKPLMLHVRNGLGTNAYEQALVILKEHAKVRANFHFFAGSIGDMDAASKLGCSFSFTGVITFARNYDQLIETIPIDRLMSETDCPYVTPIPYRGKRNEPVYVIEVVKQIAKIRGEDQEIVATKLLKNAVSFFGLNI
ncbi:MAG: TatD family hydrolase [Candidatus Taylorbacteria bacterium]